MTDAATNELIAQVEAGFHGVSDVEYFVRFVVAFRKADAQAEIRRLDSAGRVVETLTLRHDGRLVTDRHFVDFMDRFGSLLEAPRAGLRRGGRIPERDLRPQHGPGS
jgi:hypothetical protein